jgi:hypothetical protein
MQSEGNKMKVLVACEESQRVCIAFREKGHEAYSCDIVEPSGGHPEWHIHGDVLDVLDGGTVVTMDGKSHDIGKWDMMIAHPPCTYLTVSGNRWFNVDRYGEKAVQRAKDRDDGVQFFITLACADIPKIAVENPIGWMNTHYRKPDQIIHPYMFGDPVSKATCLWLKGLPKLTATNIVDPEWQQDSVRGKRFSGAAWYAADENGKAILWNDPRTAQARSRTFPGIARAMAEQWG